MGRLVQRCHEVGSGGGPKEKDALKSPPGCWTSPRGSTRNRVEVLETDEAGLDHPGRFMRECLETGQEL
jgi:hypothetical protein